MTNRTCPLPCCRSSNSSAVLKTALTVSATATAACWQAVLNTAARLPFSLSCFASASWLLVEVLGQDFFPNVDAGQFLLHMRARTGTRIEETARLADQITQAIRREIPPDELGGMLDNIGIPNSSINLSYNTSGVIGPARCGHSGSLKPGHAPTENYVRQLREQLNREFPGTMFYFLPADIVSQTLNFGLPAPFDIQIVGRDLASQPRHRRAARGANQAHSRRRGRARAAAGQLAAIPHHRGPRQGGGNGADGTERRQFRAARLERQQPGAAGLLAGPKVGIQYLINVRAPEYAMDSLQQLNAMPISAGPSGDSQRANSREPRHHRARERAAGRSRITTSCRSLTFTAAWTAAISAACCTTSSRWSKRSRKNCRAAAASSCAARPKRCAPAISISASGWSARWC